MNLRGAKNKLISTIIAVSVIAINFASLNPAKAAISASNLVSMTNSARASAGLKPYKINSKLSASAYSKAQDMLKYDYFEHFSPQGKSPWIFIKNEGYTYTFAGENLAIDFNNNSAVFAAWMASPTHKSNILDKDFTEIGIASLTGEYQGRQATVIVQHFGTQPQKIAQPLSPQLASAKIKPIEINLVSDIETPQLKEINPKELFWYTSPALILIHALV